MLSTREKVTLHSEMTEYGFKFLILDITIWKMLPVNNSDHMKLQSIENFHKSVIIMKYYMFKII